MRTTYGLVLLAAIGCGGKHAPDDLKVTGTPTGELTAPLHVTVAFSRPMVTHDQLAKPIAAPPLDFAPALPGEARWTDDKTLVVTPTGNLPLSTRYVATVPKGTKALDGNELGEPFTFQFNTERLTASLDLVGSAERATRDQPVRLTFNQEVPFAQVVQHCHFTAGSPQAVKNGPQSPSGPARSYTIAPAAELALDTAWTVACDAGLTGSVGNLGLDKVVDQKFHTYGPLHFVKLDPSGKDIVPDEAARLKLVFTNAVKPPYEMALVPAVPGFPQNCHALDDTTPGLSCAVMLDAQTNYTLTIEPKQVDTFGQTLGKQEVLAFHTTDAKPTLSMESGYFLAELKRPVLPVWARNVKTIAVTAVQVTPDNFHELRPLIDWWDPKPADFKKTKLAPTQKTIAVTGPKNQWSQHPLGAAELFGGVAGPGMFYLELGSSEVDSRPYDNGGRQKILVNFTDIGVVSKLSGSRGLVWATRLSTGKPLPGAAVSVRDDTGKVTWAGVTDADGIAVLPGTSQLTATPKGAKAADGLDPAGEHYAQEGGTGGGDLASSRIFVQDHADWTMVNPSRSNGLSAWGFDVSVDSDRSPVKLRGFMHTDRGLYRPGEKVHVKGLARITKLGEPLDVPAEGKKVKVTVDGPHGKTFTEVEAKLSAFGGFWFDLDLPGDARLGDYVIHARLDGGSFTRDFTVEDYRPASYEVTGKTTVPMIVGKGDVKGTVSANYFYGAPVRGGKVALTVHSRSRRVAFTGYDSYEFFDERRYERYYQQSEQSQTLVTEDHVTLDDKGNAAIAVPISPADVAFDADLLVRASVTAPNNEVVNKSFTIPYFKANTYFGIRSPGYFIDVGKPQTFQLVAVTADGKPTSGPAKVTVSRRDWNCVWEDWGYRGNYQCKDTTQMLSQKTVQLVAGKPTDFEVTAPSGGDYLMVVEGESEQQGAAASALQIYAYGDGGGSWKSTDSMALEMVADKKAYKIGDTATLILKTDLAQATGLVTIERDGVLEKHLMTLSPKEKHLKVPITGNYAPNVYVSVALVQGRMGEGTRGKPRMRMGIINLPVRPEDNTLAVAIETDKKDYRPGEQVTATVKVADATGKPVSAEVSITASDEGVLSLIGYETPNPIPTFYAAWGLGVTTATQLEYIRDIPGPNLERPATGGDAAGTIRSRFVSTAVWTPGAVTDATGVATVRFVAPDNLTAFRVMALAADRGHRFGSADKRFTVSKPLQLHAALPRFLDVGDELEGGVVVHNETGKPGLAVVKLVTDKHLTALTTERTIDIAKDARVPVLFHLTAAEPGEAVLQFSVTMGADSDAVELKLPVQQPSPLRRERLASGVAKGPTTVPIALPAHLLAGSAEIVLSVDPDGLSGIEDGLGDLIHYPYGCLEQTTSKMIPMIAVRELADALAIDGLTGPALESYVKAGITKIGRHQSTYGGFSLWPGGDPDAYYTAYALWGLYLARQANYPVDQTRIDDGLEYLRNDGQNPSSSRPHYSDAGNLGSQAFALYVRAVLGDKAAKTAAVTMSAEAGKLPIYGKAWLARALAAGLGAKDPVVVNLVGQLATIASAAARTDALIQEPAEREMWAYMSSSARTSAIVLLTLVELDPKNAAIPALVATVMKHRHKDDDWDTQSNLFSLLALTAYARTVSSTPVSLTAELAGAPVLSGALTGKQRLRVGSAPLTAATELKLTPTGEVHYNVEIRYRRTVDALVAESHGITLTHEYLDEAGKPKTTFVVGDLVRVRLKGELKTDSDFLMLSDALPAGFEALNTRYKTVGEAGVAETQEWSSYREIHDDRVNFASEYRAWGDDVHEFTIRAIAAGKFARPPTVATQMYEPAINAQTAFDVIEIKAK